MTEQERINENLQRQINAQNARIDNVLTKVDGLIDSLQDFKDEMRQQNQMRADEIREIRQDMKDMQKNFYSKMDNMDSKIDAMGKYVRNMSWIVMAAIGAMVVTVIISLLRN